MSGRIESADAARALSEIDGRREQVIRRSVRVAFPGWYWWTNAVLMIALTASIESRRGVLLGIGITVFVAGQLITTVPVSRAARAAPPRRGLDTPGSVRGTLVAMAAFVAVLVAVMLGTLLSLKAAGVPYPATIGVTVAAVLFAVGGQVLMRYLTAILVRRSRSRQ